MVLATVGEETPSPVQHWVLCPGLLDYWLKSVKGGGCYLSWPGQHRSYACLTRSKHSKGDKLSPVALLSNNSSSSSTAM